MCINRKEAVCEAVTWCNAWGYGIQTLELDASELIDLLTERTNNNLHYISASGSPPAIQGMGTGCYQLFGVNIQYAGFPKRSMIRTRYLQLINTATWIEWLADEMECYV